jgi:sensor histidine kinase YesM
MKQVNNFLTAIFTNRWMQYLVFWGAIYIILARVFSYDGTIKQIDLVYTGLFMVSIGLAVGINSFVLIPRFLAKSKYAIYGVCLAIILAVATWFNIFTFQYLPGWIFPGYYFITYYSWYQVLQFMIAAVSVTTLLQLSRSWFREAELRQSLAELEQEKVATELKALRAQINPHFLFNSLNHIYALASKQSEQTAPAVLQLSQLLRYAIQNMNNEKVPLADEISYLKKFTNLYKNRTQHSERVKLNINYENGNFSIAPMILVVFVENCFKHGSITQEGEHIAIDLTVENNILTLHTQNTIDSKRELPQESTEQGLDNVRRRLELLYPDKHLLQIQQTNGQFNIELKMELS